MSGVNSIYSILCLIIVVALFTSPVFSASEQQRLIDLVNQYRLNNSRSAVTKSYWLTATAMMHTIDRRDNGYPNTYGCSSGHSWSGQSTLFTGPCCYSGTNWECMGKKPGEISKNRFTGTGYENWVQASSVEQALEAWKNSVAHNEVMLNLNGWAGSTWKSIGAGVCGGFYGLWFSELADPDINGDIDQLTCNMVSNGPIPSPGSIASATASKSAIPASKTSAPSKSITASKTSAPSKSITASKTSAPSKTATASKTSAPSITCTPTKLPSTPSKTMTPSNTPLPQNPKLWLGGLSVSDNNWVKITMNQIFVEPVIVCSMYYAKPQKPLVLRMKNVIDRGNTFEIQLVGTLSGSIDVQCVAVEAGTYTVGKNGIKLEAKRVTSTITNSRSSWSTGTSINFANSYTNPVVLGQVMTANDPKKSVFYARASDKSSSSIPTGATSCVIGKQVGEDPNTVRANEQLGYIVIEAGNGNWGPRKYEAIKGTASIYGIDNNPPYSYALSGKVAATFGINSVNSVVGADGGYSIFYGTKYSAYQNNRIALAIDEDNDADTERYHGNAESVGVLLFQ